MNLKIQKEKHRLSTKDENVPPIPNPLRFQYAQPAIFPRNFPTEPQPPLESHESLPSAELVHIILVTCGVHARSDVHSAALSRRSTAVSVLRLGLGCNIRG